MNCRRITTRSATDADRPFRIELYASTREAELAVLPWDETARRAFIQQQFNARERSWQATFPAAAHEIVEVDSERVGVIATVDSEGSLHVLDIALLAPHRGRGLGTTVLSRILAEADRSGRAVSLHVDVESPARRLYERLGFRAVSHDAIRVFMERPTRSYAAGHAPNSPVS